MQWILCGINRLYGAFAWGAMFLGAVQGGVHTFGTFFSVVAPIKVKKAESSKKLMNYMSDDLNSSYNPWSREFGVIVFQVFDVYVCYRFLVSMLSFSKEYHFKKKKKKKSHGTSSTTLYFHEF